MAPLPSIKNAVEAAPLEYRVPLLEAIEEFEIPNPFEFLATVYYETYHLKNLEEYSDYTSDALLKKFDRKRISYVDAMEYGRSPDRPADPVAILNAIYGGTWGERHLGNHLPNDGWHFRGQGPIHMRGRRAWLALADFLGESEIAVSPSIIVRDPALSCRAAAWFWMRYMNLGACGNNLRAVTRTLTGDGGSAIRTRTMYRADLLGATA